MLLSLFLAANTLAVADTQFVAAPKSLATLLSQAGFPCPWDEGAATLVRGEKGFQLVHFSSTGVESLGSLQAPAEGLEYANVWGACGTTVVVMSNLKTYLYEGTRLAKAEPWPFAIAGAACDGARVFLFPRLSPAPESPGKEAAVRVVDLATGKEEVWLASPAREKPDDPFPVYATVKGALTTSGKLWVVGLYTGEVRLFSPQGKLLWQGKLPPEAGPQKVGDEEQNLLRSQLEAEVTGDATKRRPQKVQVLVPTKEVTVSAVGSWGEALVVLTENTTPRQVLVVSPDGQSTRRFSLPSRFSQSRAAVTAEGIWFQDPPGYFPRSLFEGEGEP